VVLPLTAPAVVPVTGDVQLKELKVTVTELIVLQQRQNQGYQN
jgi:hypothetical protein